MKISNLGLIFIGVVVIAYVAYKNNKIENPFVLSTSVSDTISTDSIPTSKYYSKTIVLRGGGKSDLGNNPLVNHQVPTDYVGYNNNWDEDLHHIK